jgi:hypothetical protein
VITIGLVSATGNVTGNFFIGNGSQLTGISAGASYSNANVATFMADFGSNTISTTGNVTSSNSITSNIFVGTASRLSVGRVEVLFDGAGQCGIAARTSWAGLGSTFIQFENSSGTTQGHISQASNTTVNYSTASDYRLKENIQPMTGALVTVAQLKPVTYTWKEDGSAGQGFIAHELAEVMPDCVSGEKDAVWPNGAIRSQGVDTSFLVATLTKAIQELQAEVDLLKQQIASWNVTGRI